MPTPVIVHCCDPPAEGMQGSTLQAGKMIESSVCKNCALQHHITAWVGICHCPAGILEDVMLCVQS